MKMKVQAFLLLPWITCHLLPKLLLHSTSSLKPLPEELTFSFSRDIPFGTLQKISLRKQWMDYRTDCSLRVNNLIYILR